MNKTFRHHTSFLYGCIHIFIYCPKWSKKYDTAQPFITKRAHFYNNRPDMFCIMGLSALLFLLLKSSRCHSGD